MSKLTTLILLACWLPCAASWVGGSYGCGGSGQVSLGASESPNQRVVYYLDDHLGNANLLVDANGNVLREEGRYPYGLDRKIEGSAPADYVYTGKELDEETGLVYFGGRYYVPELGRWASPDNYFIENPTVTGDKPLSSNLYAYVRNNPTTYIDPKGEIDSSAFRENRLAYHDQYRDNFAPKSPEEQMLQTSVGAGLVTLIAAPVVLHAGVAIAPYAASAELAAGRAAYTVSNIVAEKAAAGVGYAVAVGDEAATLLMTTASDVATQGVTGYALTHPEGVRAFGEGVFVGFSSNEGESYVVPTNSASEYMFNVAGEKVGSAMRQISGEVIDIYNQEVVNAK